MTCWFSQQHGWISVHLTTWKKPDSKAFKFYDFIDMTFWKSENYKERRQISGFQGLRKGEGLITKGHEGIREDDKTVLYLEWVAVTRLGTCTKTHRTIHQIRSSHCIEIKSKQMILGSRVWFVGLKSNPTSAVCYLYTLGKLLCLYMFILESPFIIQISIILTSLSCHED